MMAVICTLFEGDYHNGVAALTNSLYKQGFQGSVYIGYKGALPIWIRLLTEFECKNWKGGRAFIIEGGICLYFLPLDTDYHLTNYKPDFMLRLWEDIVPTATSFFYFDPDIIITAPWTYFENWVMGGVALCEDVNSPLTQNHPRRIAWRNYFGKREITLTYKSSIYANGGFIGVHIKNKDFLLTWKKIQEEMAPAIGGLNRSSLTGLPLPKEFQGPFSPFGKTDQDALNAAVETWNGEVSFVGQEAMGFKPGEPLMPHALGTPKPWKKKFLLTSMNGVPPSGADKAFWSHVSGPIKLYKTFDLVMKSISISMAAFIGRFYSRN